MANLGHGRLSFFSNCSRLVGVTWPVPPHSGQALRRNGNRLGTSPLPLHTGHSRRDTLRLIVGTQKTQVAPASRSRDYLDPN